MSRFDELPAWARNAIDLMVADIAATEYNGKTKATFILDKQAIEVASSSGGKSLIVSAPGSAIHIRKLSSGGVVLDVVPKQSEQVVMTMWAEPPQPKRERKVAAKTASILDWRSSHEDMTVDLWPELSD